MGGLAYPFSDFSFRLPGEFGNSGPGSCEEIVARSNNAIAKLASAGKLRR